MDTNLVEASPTGDIPRNAAFSSDSALHGLKIDDRKALWGGCLDATDRLPSGSHANFTDQWGTLRHGTYAFRGEA